MKLLWIAALAALPTVALAQYKCVAPGGAVTFQQTACATSASETRVGPKPPPPPYQLPHTRPEYIRKAFAEKRFAIGMTLGEVYLMVGKAPERENTTLTARGTSRQLVYEAQSTTFYVYVSEEDVVTAIQVSHH